MKHNKINGEFVLESGNSLYVLMIVLAGVMFYSATRIFIFEIKLCFQGGHDLFGVCFSILWYIINFFILRFSVKRYSQKLIINHEGVRMKCILPIFRDDVLNWDDIVDYGYMYYNKASDKDPLRYELYFSSKTLKKVKNIKAKNTRKSKIRFFIMQDDLKFIENYIFPYCLNYSSVDPFKHEII